MTQKINLSLACYPSLEFHEAMARATRDQPSEALFGPLCLDQVQLCPQNRGVLNNDYIDMLRCLYPNTRFRLHANVRVLPTKQMTDWSAWDARSPYWQALAAASQRLQAPAYTAHAGRRCEASLTDVIASAKQAADMFDCPVGVEGHYPTSTNIFLVSTWAEYRTLFESGVPYVVDLSHLHIVAEQSGIRDFTLIQEMLSCERCLEVHVSDNDGIHDQHKLLNEEPWWWHLMPYAHANTTIFSEGTQNRIATGII